MPIFTFRKESVSTYALLYEVTSIYHLLSTGLFQEMILTRVHNRTEIN